MTSSYNQAMQKSITEPRANMLQQQKITLGAVHVH